MLAPFLSPNMPPPQHLDWTHTYTHTNPSLLGRQARIRSKRMERQMLDKPRLGNKSEQQKLRVKNRRWRRLKESIEVLLVWKEDHSDICKFSKQTETEDLYARKVEGKASQKWWAQQIFFVKRLRGPSDKKLYNYPLIKREQQRGSLCGQKRR